MNGMSAGLSDQDIEDLAAYFSSQDAKAGTTPEDVIESEDLVMFMSHAKFRVYIKFYHLY